MLQSCFDRPTLGLFVQWARIELVSMVITECQTSNNKFCKGTAHNILCKTLDDFHGVVDLATKTSKC